MPQFFAAINPVGIVAIDRPRGVRRSGVDRRRGPQGTSPFLPGRALGRGYGLTRREVPACRGCVRLRTSGILRRRLRLRSRQAERSGNRKKNPYPQTLTQALAHLFVFRSQVPLALQCVPAALQSSSCRCLPTGGYIDRSPSRDGQYAPRIMTTAGTVQVRILKSSRQLHPLA